jgi:LPXTG-site transpeptidase (sortase) family protein
MKARSAALLWLERAFIAIGVCLAIWCAKVLVEARYTASLPPAKVTMTAADGEPARRPPIQEGTVLARLEIPSLKIATTVLEGSGDETLRKASGHIEETPLPGEAGNVGIAGHRDTVFRPLEHAKAGDALNVTTADHVYHYAIRKTFIVDPQDVSVLDATDRPTLTLVTCYPFQYMGHAPRRFIVRAELVGIQ